MAAAPTARAVRAAEQRTDTEPTEAQKRDSNYAKGSFSWHGLKIAVENPKGSVRSGVGSDGKRWSVVMPCTYGEITKTEGMDEDPVDAFVGPDHDSQRVFVIDQVDAKTKRPDEHKVMLSFRDKGSAIRAYEGAFSDGKGKDRIGAVTELSVPGFKDWLVKGSTERPMVKQREGLLAMAKRFATGGRVQQFAPGGPARELTSDILNNGFLTTGDIKEFGGIEDEAPPALSKQQKARAQLDSALNFMFNSGPGSRYGEHAQRKLNTNYARAGFYPEEIPDAQRWAAQERGDVRDMYLPQNTKKAGLGVGAAMAAPYVAPYAASAAGAALTNPVLAAASMASGYGMVPPSRDPDAPPGTEQEALGTALMLGSPALARAGYTLGAAGRGGMNWMTQHPVATTATAAGLMSALPSNPGTVGEKTALERAEEELQRHMDYRAQLMKQREAAQVEKSKQLSGAEGRKKGQGKLSDTEQSNMERLDAQIAKASENIDTAQEEVRKERFWTTTAGKQALEQIEKNKQHELDNRMLEEKVLGKWWPTAIPAATGAGALLTGVSRYTKVRDYNRAVKNFMGAWKKGGEEGPMAFYQNEVKELHDRLNRWTPSDYILAGVPVETQLAAHMHNVTTDPNTEGGTKYRGLMHDPVYTPLLLSAPFFSSAFAKALGDHISDMKKRPAFGKGVTITGGGRGGPPGGTPMGEGPGGGPGSGPGGEPMGIPFQPDALKIARQLGELDRARDLRRGIAAPTRTIDEEGRAGSAIPREPVQDIEPILPETRRPSLPAPPEPAPIVKSDVKPLTEAPELAPGSGPPTGMSVPVPPKAPEKSMIFFQRKNPNGTTTYHFSPDGYIPEGYKVNDYVPDHMRRGSKPNPDWKPPHQRDKGAGGKGQGARDATDNKEPPGPKEEEPKKARGGFINAIRRAVGGSVLSGPLHGATGGRADEVPGKVRAGSYVIPADIIAGRGQGNTDAGQRWFEAMERHAMLTGSHRIDQNRLKAASNHHIDARVAHGERIIPPETVAAIGNGDLDHGHAILDSMVKQWRDEDIHTLATLPPPVKS